MDAVESFKATLIDAGLNPGVIVPDGKLRRCGTQTKPKSKNGWYVCYPDPCAGAYGDWRTGLSETWSNGGDSLSSEDWKKLKRQINRQKKEREAAEAKRHQDAAKKARRYLGSCQPVTKDNPYLKKKGVAPCPHLLADGDVLIVSIFSPDDNEPMSLQRIEPDGGKRFMKDGRTSGGFFTIHGDSEKIVIVEGIATGLSINQATGHTVIVAFSAGNIAAVAKMVRNQYPDRIIITAADNDAKTEDKTGINPGIKYATEAAMAIKGLVAVPNQSGDWNDVHQSQDLKAVKAGIDAAKKPATPKADSSEEWPKPIPFDNIDAPAIPPETIPGQLREFCELCAESIQVPLELPVMATLGVIASAAQGKFKVQVKEGYAEPLCVYLFTPLKPGERKSSTVDECKKPLAEWETEQAIIIEPEIKAAVSERLTREKAIATLRNSAGKPKAKIDQIVREVQDLEDSLPEIPVAPRLFVDDTTPEALAEFMSKHNDRAAVIEAEGGIFELIAGLYTKGRSNINIWLKAWSGEKISVDRRSRDAIHINNPALTLCLLPQPEVLRDIGSKSGFRGRGLLGRFLYCLPKSRLGSRTTEVKPIPAGVSANYTARLLQITELPWAIGPTGEKTPYIITLSSEAYRKWVTFAESIEAELGDGGEFYNFTDWAGKIPGQAIRIAGLFHLVESSTPVTEEISGSTMSMALNLAAIFTEHAKIAFSQMGSDPAVECAQKIWKWVTTENVQQFSARDALQNVKGDHRFSKMDQVNPGLIQLEERCYIRKLETNSPKRRGRKPSQMFEINPLAHNSHNTHK